MRMAVLVLTAWLFVSVVSVTLYALGAQVGYRRGYQEGWRAGRAERARARSEATSWS